MNCLADIAILLERTKPVALPKIITPELRELARIAAGMNADRKELCRDDQPALRAFFETNEKLLLEIAS